MDKKIIILGAGPTGLGAAWRLKELGYKNFTVFEKEKYPGGLSASFSDKKGFTWDLGGHVIHSHFKYFDNVVKRSLGDKIFSKRRKSYIWQFERLIPYPFQNNIHLFPPFAFLESFLGILAGKKKGAKNFGEFAKSTFGSGIAKHFMIPYNQKMWKFPLSKMDINWIGEKVSIPTLTELIKNAAFGKKESDWGSNGTFLYPKLGIGQLWNRISKKVGAGHIKYESEIVKIDTQKKIIYLANGHKINFDILISSIPITNLIGAIEKVPSLIRNLVRKLPSTSMFILGLGVKKIKKNDLSWVYFPQKDIPFFRISIISNYSPYMTPKRGFSSILTESTSSEEIAAEDAIRELEKINLMGNEKIVSLWTKKIEFAYPIPTLDRDKILTKIQTYLEAKSIYSRGRFGAFKYEISNMDYCFMQGVEIVERIVLNKNETIWTLT